MEILLTAKDARKKASEANFTKDRENLDKVARVINDAISKGECTVSYTDHISERTKSALVNLGYSISKYNCPDMPCCYYIISWKEKISLWTRLKKFVKSLGLMTLMEMSLM